MKKDSSGTKPITNVKTKYSFKRLLLGSDLSIRRLPIMSATAAQPGPTVWLTACAHGDEVCGMVVIQEIFRRARERLKRGAIYALPLMNPFGFENSTRKITPSQEDLNRCYPGDPRGSLGERMADMVFTMIVESQPDLVLDLHTDWKRSIPYVVVDASPGPKHQACYKQARSYALSTGLVGIQEQDILASTLSYNLLLRDIPSLTLELGEPYVINEANVSFGMESIWKVLTTMGLCDPMTTAPCPAEPARILAYYDRPHSSVSGIIRFLAQPGDTIRTGQAFAKIMNVFGKHQETVYAKRDGVILGHTDSSVVFPGMPIMAFGVEQSS